jgi:hypothetical protein
VELIQDWKAYKKSIIWDLANSYYKTKGISAWSDSLEKKVPHVLSTNYQNALATAKLLKKLIESNPQGTFRVLECGAGSGKFTRNFLFALKELEILDRIKLSISDYSKQNLYEIKSKGLLNDFDEKHYEFLELDLIHNNLDEKFDLVLVNYVFNSMGLTILKNIGGEVFQELELKVYKPEAQTEMDVLSNINLQNSLIKETRWVDYEISLQSELERLYFNFIKSKYLNSEKSFAYYFNVIHSIKVLLNNLNEAGLIFITELLPSDENYDPLFISFPMGNALGHDVDMKTICEYFDSLNIVSKYSSTTARAIISKNDLTLFDGFFMENYGPESDFHRLMTEIANLDEISQDLNYLDRSSKLLIELNPYAPKSYKLRSRFYELLGDKNKALEMMSKAIELDFWDDLKSDLKAKL